GPGPAEDRAGALTDVLAVLPGIPPGPGRDRLTDVAEQLVRLLIHAHHRTRRVIAAVADREHILHPRRELRVRPGRDGPALLQVRAKFCFLTPVRSWSGPCPGCPRSARHASPAAAATTAHARPAGPSTPARSAWPRPRRSPARAPAGTRASS